MDIILLKVDEKVTWAELEGFTGCLGKAKRRGILAKKNDTDRINALLSRLLTLSELSKRTGMPMRKIAFEFGPHGKPYVRGGGIQYSLSHTRGAVCVGFSDGSEIGVDIERADRKVSPALYGRVLSDNERAAVKSDRDMIKCWVRKEAFLKRMGIGLASELRGVDTTVLPDTAVLNCGEFLIGASGDNAPDTVVGDITLDELLGRFVKLGAVKMK